MAYNFTEEDFLACCESTKFAEWMVKMGPYFSLPQAIQASREIWWGKVDVADWLQAFNAHPQIGDVEALKATALAIEWSKGEQSTAMISSTEKVLQELVEWNQKYEDKFGFRFLISASGKSSAEILQSLKDRFSNRPVDELQIAAAEEQKIIEIRLNKLFGMRDKPERPSVSSGISPERPSASSGSLSVDRRISQIVKTLQESSVSTKNPQVKIARPSLTTHVLGRPIAGTSDMPEGPLDAIDESEIDNELAKPDTGIDEELDAETDNEIDGSNAELPSAVQTNTTQVSNASDVKSGAQPPITNNVSNVSNGNPGAQIDATLSIPAQPPITTHVLDVSRGMPGAGIDVALDMWKGDDSAGEWGRIGASITNSDGRSGPLMSPSNTVAAGRYRLTFNTGKYFEKFPGSNGEDENAVSCFFPYVSVVFDIKPSQISQHFHIPILLSPFSFTTYRGS